MFLEETQKYIYKIRKPIGLRETIKDPVIKVNKKKPLKISASSPRLFHNSINSEQKLSQASTPISQDFLKSSKQNLLPRIFSS